MDLRAAERLYTKAGFEYVQTKNMYYEDTGWTEYVMYELVLSDHELHVALCLKEEKLSQK